MVMHWERPPELAAAGKVGECTCGHAWNDHGRRKPPGSPAWETTGCRLCVCGKHVNRDGSKWPFGVGP